MHEEDGGISYCSTEEFIEKVVDKWTGEVEKPGMITIHFHDANVDALLYALAEELVDEISPTQVYSLTPDTVKSFIVAAKRGFSVQEVIHSYLCGPCNPEALAILRSIYSDNFPPNEPQQVVH